MKCSAFCCGTLVGMALGAAVGASVVCQRRSMKTCVGRTVQSMGSAMDGALEDLLRAIR